MKNTVQVRLKTWLKRSRISQIDLAARLECDESFVSHVLAGRRRPSLLRAAAIERLTGIPASAWADQIPRRIAA